MSLSSGLAVVACSCYVFVTLRLEEKHMKSVEDLDVFKLSHQLALEIYLNDEISKRRNF